MTDLFDILLAKNLSGGGGGGSSAIAYTSIVDNGDNTITATDDKGVEHTIAYVVGADGKITSLTLDGKTQSITYDENGVLTAIGETEVDIESVPAANEFSVTVTFMNGAEEWAKVGVDGEGKIAEPTVPPIPPHHSGLQGWYSGDEKIDFPFKPISDTVLNAKFYEGIVFDGSFLVDCNDLQCVDKCGGVIPTTDKISELTQGRFDNGIVCGYGKWLGYSVPDLPAYVADQFTLELWFKLNEQSDNHTALVSFYEGSNGRGTIDVSSTNTSLYASRVRMQGTFESPLPLNQWHHFAYVHEHPGNNSIYINGKLCAQNPSENGWGYFERGLYIGINGAFGGYESQYFDGCVDQIAVFNYVKYDKDFTPPAHPYIIE